MRAAQRLACIAMALIMVAAASEAAAEQYFAPELLQRPADCPTRGAAISEVESEWFPRQWRAAGEPSLFEASRSPDTSGSRTYRFTWLRTFHAPMFVRLDVRADGRMLVTAKMLSGAGGYDPGHVARRVRRVLSEGEQARVEAALSGTQIRTSPAPTCPEIEEVHVGADGAEWILEANESGAYRYQNQFSPPEGALHRAGLVLLGLTGWSIQPVY